MITSLFKVYGDNELARQTFTENDEAVAWALKNCTTFGIFEMHLMDGRIETAYECCDFGIYIAKAEDNDDHLVYHHEELLGRFPEKARRKTILCVINRMLEVLREEEEHYAAQYEDADAMAAFYGGYSIGEGPHGGAFEDEQDFARHVGIDLQY